MPLQPLMPPPSNGEITIIEPLCAFFRKKLKSEGLKYTPERAHILDAILGIEGVFEADALIAAMRKGGHRVSKATVYRTIRLMLDAGIIQRVLFDEELSHYQVVYGKRPNDLLVRVDTNEIIPIDVPELIAIRDRICRERGLQSNGHRFHIFATKA